MAETCCNPEDLGMTGPTRNTVSVGRAFARIDEVGTGPARP
jgi:hypothetical protein